MTPKSYGDLTVHQYIEGKKIMAQSDKLQLFRCSELLAFLYNKPLDDIEELERSVILEKVRELGFIGEPPIPNTIYKRIYINKKFYSLTFPKDINAGQFIGLEFVHEKKGIDNGFADLLACIYRPIGKNLRPKKYNGDNHEDVVKDMLQVKMKYVHGALFFCLQVWQTLNPTIEVYLAKANLDIVEMMWEIQNSKDLQVL